MLKKTMLLASLAAAAMAFAAPSAFATAGWSEGTKTVETSANATFHGSAAFIGGLGGTSCGTANATGTLTPHSTTGTITTFAPVVSTCTTSGLLGACKVTSVESTNLPWTAHTNGSDITITNVDIDTTYHGAFCPYHIIRLQGEVTIDVDDPHAGTTGTITGTLHATNGTTQASIQNVTASGHQLITPSGKYGITIGTT